MRSKCLSRDSAGFTTFGLQGSEKVFNQWNGIDWHNDMENRIYLQANSSELLPAECSPAELWYRLFEVDPPPCIRYVESSTFAVKSDTIRRRPRDFYERLLKLFADCNHINPEYGHYVERFWSTIFYSQKLG